MPTAEFLRQWYWGIFYAWSGRGSICISLWKASLPGPCSYFADAGFARQAITLYFSISCDLLVFGAPSSFQKFGVRDFKCPRVKVELKKQENEKLQNSQIHFQWAIASERRIVIGSLAEVILEKIFRWTSDATSGWGQQSFSLLHPKLSPPRC